MKPLPLLLPLLSLSVVVAVTGAFLWASHAAPSPDSAPSPAAVRGADERASADRVSMTSDSGVQAELAAIRLELAALRRLLEAQPARADAAAPRSGVRASSAGAWAELVHETEQRMLVETITRQRAHTRTVLAQEEASAADAGAMAEVREASAASVGSLKRALEALDAVRSDEELAQWREHFGIEPVN